ncbi:MAG: DUF402 domain-containing protein, partial [Sciscionella sp.]|nr:DUF402 domain-containing protein [Sciscionella sp.]
MPVPKLTVDVHPPKVERFDVDAMTNTDPKGFVRAVDEYRVESFGLYVARPMVGHPTMRYLESWLLPELNLRVTDFWFRAGHERDQDFYLDVATIDTDTDTDTGGAAKRHWRSVDHYLDLVLRTGRDLDVLDTDELLAALTA